MLQAWIMCWVYHFSKSRHGMSSTDRISPWIKTRRDMVMVVFSGSRIEIAHRVGRHVQMVT